MKFAQVRRHALSLPEVTQAPHHNFTSFRVRGRIFLTAPPDEQHLHVFVGDAERDQALALEPACLDKLLWGGKVVGLRVDLKLAGPAVVKHLVDCAWTAKAPSALSAAAGSPAVRGFGRKP